jgi:hypothetical protein
MGSLIRGDDQLALGYTFAQEYHNAIVQCPKLTIRIAGMRKMACTTQKEASQMIVIGRKPMRLVPDRQ